MSYKHFYCDWLVRPLKTEARRTKETLLEIHAMARKHECELLVRHYKTWKTRADGCHILTFAWRTPSEKHLDKCLKELNPYIHFENFQEVAETDFTNLILGVTATALEQIVSDGLGEGVAHIENMGISNEAILAKGTT